MSALAADSPIPNRLPPGHSTGTGVDSPPAATGRSPEAYGRYYLPVGVKFTLSLTLACSWCALSVWLSLPWLNSLADLIGFPLALLLIVFIAYVPGFMNAFLITTILLDRRPERRFLDDYPAISILIACYNEAGSVGDTIHSLVLQDYPGRMEVLILDDGSTDTTIAEATAAIAKAVLQDGHTFRIVSGGANAGKSSVLNRGLALAAHTIILTIDGDSWVYDEAIRRLVERYCSDPANTRAVAGAVLVRNSRRNWLTRAQEWDYFHGIAAVKRMQSMYHGTLVAQGAFSLYDRTALEEVGGWPECIGEDIVVSWAMLERGYRIGYCEDAVIFTKVPEQLGQFAKQRKRWSRGLMEAFAAHPRLLLKPRLTLLFIWWNVLFLPLDLVYTFAFLPGIVLALFGHYYIVGIMTLAVLPLAALWNYFIFRVQGSMFKRQDLRVRRNVSGFLFYVLGYSMLMQPVCVWGYISELLGLRKQWDTK